MKVVCTYCRSLIREKAPLRDATTTHAICDACFEHYAPQWDGLPLGRYLDRFEAPIMAVDADVKVVAMNRRMAEVLQLDPDEARGVLGGEVFECIWARHPDGCGRSVHCKTCTVRNSVAHTVATGEAVERAPATLTQDDTEIRLLVSTRLHGDLVHLLIEPTA